MPSYRFDKYLGVTMVSSKRILPGQTARSSLNYDLRQVKRGRQIRWLMPDGWSFDIKEDKTAAKDPITFERVHNGTVTNFPSDDSCWGLYFANPYFNGSKSSYDGPIQIKIEVIY